MDGTDLSELRVISRGVTADELAAVTAVLGAAIEEEAARSPRRAAAPSAWSRSQRAIRTTIVAGEGRWRGFSA
ncbi:acyl-CoA carboxylase subunit epsilon [Compostimonas suwonensis]|uniref:Acyl-CoA carboxylase epsilon subunit-like protein n=1 Tax=Compostimonas suwonensis TaxID=1048394 RepID=A0A2M9BUY7_9MICO|nr:acyl-CoA carboxylase subunit epsilon [Compostimonas suwonensis]PJJ61766.1 acyl-CoA carboxylase epsilon subunit-like protein [Compostimonas suwonensis]